MLETEHNSAIMIVKATKQKLASNYFTILKEIFRKLQPQTKNSVSHLWEKRNRFKEEKLLIQCIVGFIKLLNYL